MALSAVCPVALIKKTQMKIKTDLISSPFRVISYTNPLTPTKPEPEKLSCQVRNSQHDRPQTPVVNKR